MSNHTAISSEQPTTTGTGSATSSISEEQRRAFWAKVLAADPQAAQWAKKRLPRLAYERAGVVVRATHPGGGSTESRVYAHDLSEGGMSFLHQGYLHVGTAVIATLPRRLTGEDQATGRVAWCMHVGGSWHATGVKFNEPISPKPYVSPAEYDRLPAGGEPIRPESLTGQVLMVDDQDVDRMLFAHLLRATKLAVTGVADVAQAVAALRGLVFDVVCVDLNLGVGKQTGEDAIAAIRRGGHKGPMVVISGATAGRMDAVREATGVEHTLSKPYDADQLMATLAAALNVGGTDPADLIYSTLSQQDGMTELLTMFCDRVGQTMREFKRHVDAGRLDDVRLVCATLKGTAGGYGYSTVAAAAAEAVTALDSMGDVGEAGPALQKLAGLCRRLTPNRKARTAE